MAKQKEQEKATVVAELTVTSGYGTEIVKSFDTAWHRALDIWSTQDVATPINVKFNQFVRRD